MNKLLSLLSIIFLTTSCQMYCTKFDCPPGEGVPCTSVTDIESMVIETNEGPDVLAGFQAWKKLIPIIPPCQTRKVWVADTDTENGCHIDGHYIYIFPNGEEN
jgi:hypothetical protein